MTIAQPDSILSADEGAPVEVLNPGGAGDVVLVCEHASAFVPVALDGLGLKEADRLSHAAWDPGALEMARAMSEVLDAPLVAARVSRLVYDCNRPPEAPGAMPEKSEVIEVPGNRGLTAEARGARVREVYEPFTKALASVLAARQDAAMVTVHSFTPVWFGQPRDAEIGILHDADPALAEAMMAQAGALPARAELNVPYSAADGVTHTLKLHGAGRRNVMIEVRNDLIATDAAAAEMGRALAVVVRDALEALA
ncbi:N-formylglutamate amidohydrolase [Oceanicola sp. 22II-s10i]|uniref:N-formylglutamate amidohydrolase n=1 Tax=Oceanicola sp. 22II-s10i TaxID=1317116 RepID=UPI000B526364|nr:N-formylglutamate amidohydrolase [Oceanicola sp. 22II-s10i]OWU86805.1 N-formylglutamate amidohydrolase [Oceanicola sp. 22II-s10i]